MTPERWRHVKELFESALEHDPANRAEFLRQACAGDRDLPGEVEKLLAADAEEDHPLEVPISGVAARLLARGWAEQYVGQRIGPYRIRREIGRGGMGAVYEAVRDDGQYEEVVAVKLIKRGMDTDAIIGRFRQERQILASLDHPNVAKLLAGGMTDDGLPYFVMEHIRGVPIDRYCDERKLPTVERIKLFLTVCAAVDAAHRSMVVHCDLKPGNVLVTADGVPKLVDFGIAKLLDPRHVPQARTATVGGQRLMTPDYASPEQLRGQAITTASDVYALGVVLYELLTGHRPFRFESQSRREIEQVICDREPEKPSTAIRRTEKLTDDGGATLVVRSPESVSSTRDGTPEKLRRRLAGDLDRIVLKAIRKEPAQRYRSVEQLSEDLRRYLEGRPVLARKATLGYRAGKFARRNWLALAAVTAVFLSWTAGIVTTAWQAREARTQRGTAERTLAFLVDLFKASEPAENPNLTVREVLDEGARRIDRELRDEPEVQATLMDAIGTVYLELGLYAEAETLLARALEMRRRELGPDDPATATSKSNLGLLRFRQSRLAEAEDLLREAWAARRGLEGGESSELADSSSVLGMLLKARGKYREAEVHLRRALELRQRLYGEEHPDVAQSLDALGLLHHAQGDYEQAEIDLRRALMMRRDLLGPGHPSVIASLNNVALLLRSTGDHDESETLYREALRRGEKIFGKEHPLVAGTMNNLALLLKARGDGTEDEESRSHRYREAEALYQEALEMQRKLLTPRHLNVASTLVNLGALYCARAELDRGEDLFREALKVQLELLGENHNTVATTTGNLAALLYARGRYEESTKMLRKVLAIDRRLLGDEHPDVVADMENLAMSLRKLGGFEEAEELLLEALELNRRIEGPDHPKLAKTRRKLALVYEEWGKPGEAARYRDEPVR